MELGDNLPPWETADAKRQPKEARREVWNPNYRIERIWIFYRLVRGGVLPGRVAGRAARRVRWGMGRRSVRAS